METRLIICPYCLEDVVLRGAIVNGHERWAGYPLNYCIACEGSGRIVFQDQLDKIRSQTVQYPDWPPTNRSVDPRP